MWKDRTVCTLNYPAGVGWVEPRSGEAHRQPPRGGPHDASRRSDPPYDPEVSEPRKAVEKIARDLPLQTHPRPDRAKKRLGTVAPPHCFSNKTLGRMLVAECQSNGPRHLVQSGVDTTWLFASVSPRPAHSRTTSRVRRPTRCGGPAEARRRPGSRKTAGALAATPSITAARTRPGAVLPLSPCRHFPTF